MSLFIVKAKLLEYLMKERGATAYAPIFQTYTSIINAVNSGDFDWAGESE